MSFDFGEKQDIDPTADFLARERAAAGALHDDADLFGGASANGASAAGNSLSALQGQSGLAGDRDFEQSASNFPALEGEDDGFGAPQAAVPSASAAAPSALDDDDLLGGGGAAPSAPAADVERDQFERNFPELEEEPVSAAPGYEPATNGFMAEPVRSHLAPTSDSHAAPSQFQQNNTSFGVASDPYGANEEEEPEPVRRWREEQEEDIAKREATAERRKGETISKAEQDIDNFYAEYNKKKEKNIAQNKEAEAQFKAQRQAELADGTTWSRVTKLVDLQNSQSKTIARSGPGSSDLARMKEVLLSLRREGEIAPGASGY